MAKNEATRLKRFRKLPTKIKTHLYKTLVRSKLEYPIIPICIMSKTNMKKYQSFQNRIIRNFIAPPEEKFDPIEELHERYNIEALNTRFQRRGKKTWSRLDEDGEIKMLTQQLDHDERADHYWWRRVGIWVQEDDEDPIFDTRN